MTIDLALRIFASVAVTGIYGLVQTMIWGLK